ncbi:unnamed protein product [Polarella glacialis]|uniref:Uncharacterized protein n=1 Tax=Polarella glacialis TaxID=89957 RepID=A0A813EU18_POLGL|nr:unnamed protein product [Polarella glacialis]CAE8635141.1 unnamed protein product [Polarella glacialis]
MGCFQSKADAPGVPAKRQARSQPKSQGDGPTLLTQKSSAADSSDSNLQQKEPSSKIRAAFSAARFGGRSKNSQGGLGEADGAGEASAAALSSASSGAVAQGDSKRLGAEKSSETLGSAAAVSAAQEAESSWLSSMESLLCCSCSATTTTQRTGDDGVDESMSGNMLGSLVKMLVANFDSNMLGVKVDVGALHLDPLTGKVEVQGLTVQNPEGYHSVHLLKADRVVVGINMRKLLFSLGGEVDVEELIFEGVDVIYEKSLMSSNLTDIMNKLSPDVDEQRTAATGGEKKQATGKDDLKLTLHKVLAKNVGAKVASKLTKGHGMRLEVGDIFYEDFDKEMGVGRGMMDIVRVLLMTLIKSVLATVFGKQGIKKMMGGATSALESAKRGATSISGSVGTVSRRVLPAAMTRGSSSSGSSSSSSAQQGRFGVQFDGLFQSCTQCCHPQADPEALTAFA